MTSTETTSHFKQFEAAIFDLDGTLIHSEPAWEAAKIEVMAHYGLVPTQQQLDAHVGRGLGEFLDAMFGHPMPTEKRRKIGDQIGAAADVLLPKMVEPVAGASDLLRALHKRGLRVAICSSSPRRHIVKALAMLGITECIEAVVSGAELPRGKPDPLPYLTALTALDLEPEVACAFEDSRAGAKSAFLAGMTVFAIGKGCTDSDFNFCHKQAENFHDFGEAETIRYGLLAT